MIACRNHDHPLSVAEVIMTILKGQEELDQFTLTRSEYANKIEKSPNAVRMMMRHGKLSGEYRFDGSKYLFKSPTRPRESYDNDHLNSFKLTTQTAQPKRLIEEITSKLIILTMLSVSITREKKNRQY